MLSVELYQNLEVDNEIHNIATTVTSGDFEVLCKADIQFPFDENVSITIDVSNFANQAIVCHNIPISSLLQPVDWLPRFCNFDTTEYVVGNSITVSNCGKFILIFTIDVDKPKNFSATLMEFQEFVREYRDCLDID